MASATITVSAYGVHDMTSKAGMVASLALLLSLLPSEANALSIEPRPSPPHVLFADLGLHVIGVGYQRTLSPHLAFSISGGLYDPWTVTDKVGDVRGGIVRLRPYFFLTDSAPRGLWLSPFFQGGIVSGQRAGAARVGTAAAMGGSVGYAFLFGDVVHLSLGLGAQLHGARIPDSPAAPSFYGVGFHADATVGFAFR